MKKTLVVLSFAAASLFASGASAQSDMNMEVQSGTAVEGGGGAGVVQYVSTNGETPTLYQVQSQAQAVPIQLQGQAPIPRRPLPLIQMADDSLNLPPNPPRKTNRQIIEYVRQLKKASEQEAPQNAATFEQRIENVGGTTSGQVRIFRKENGQVVEDRMVQIPESTPGKPVFFRASTTLGEGSRGSLIRTIAASGSRAVFLRNFASTTGLPWLNDGPNVTVSGRVISSTTADGNVIFSFEQRKPPIRDFMDQVFKLFKKAAGEVPAAQTSNSSF